MLDAFERERLGEVDAEDARVRERAPADSHVEGVGRIDVVGEATLAAQQPVVLAARDAGADAGLADRGGRSRISTIDDPGAFGEWRSTALTIGS